MAPDPRAANRTLGGKPDPQLRRAGPASRGELRGAVRTACAPQAATALDRGPLDYVRTLAPRRAEPLRPLQGATTIVCWNDLRSSVSRISAPIGPSRRSASSAPMPAREQGCADRNRGAGDDGGASRPGRAALFAGTTALAPRIARRRPDAPDGCGLPRTLLVSVRRRPGAGCADASGGIVHQSRRACRPGAGDLRRKNRGERPRPRRLHAARARATAARPPGAAALPRRGLRRYRAIIIGWRRWDLLDRLVYERATYTIPEVQAQRTLVGMEARRTLSRLPSSGASARRSPRSPSQQNELAAPGRRAAGPGAGARPCAPPRARTC